MADSSGGYELVASHFTLTGAGFGETPRNDFAARCQAASDAGFTGIGLHADDVVRTVESGLDFAGMRAVLFDTGIRVVEIEFLGGWAIDAGPAELERTVSRIEEAADALGGQYVTAGEFRGDVSFDVGAAAERLGELAHRLGERGLQVAVECFPWSVLAGPNTVGELLRKVEALNVGELVDVWHFYNNGRSKALSARPVAVQLNDGSRVHRDHLMHARAARRLPGAGELDVVGLIRGVLDTGFTGPWSVEVNTPEFRALPVGQAAVQAAAAASRVLDAAGAPRHRS